MQWFPKLKLWQWLTLLALVVAYLVVTLTNLTLLPIFVDEAIYLRWAQIAGGDATWRFISLTDGKQPLYTWAVIPFFKLFKDPLFAGRATSVFFGLFTMLGVGYSGWLLSGKKLAFWSMLAALFSPFLFFYNRFAVMEGTLLAFCIWIFALSILLAKSRRLDVAMILGIVTGLGLLVKSTALFYFLAIPSAYLLVVDWKRIFTKDLLRFVVLVIIAWVMAQVIYNIQRLSPWMHVIADKNAFFIVPYDEIFKNPARILNNFLDIWRWHGGYTTWPLLLVAGFGTIAWLKKSYRKGILALAWFIIPLLGTVLLARLFSSRYMVFATPFLQLLIGYGFVAIKNKKLQLALAVLAAIMPTYLVSKLLFDPIHFPYAKVDEGYVNGWSAGNGTKQIAEWAKSRLKGNPEIEKLTIYTEGTFGILPHGLELYTQKTPRLEIIGLYPINEIPPSQTNAKAFENKETYLILNNTETDGVPGGLELVESYPKLHVNPMRLYRVIPR
jgi:4-amino-4-deoxy-L-arabinose transferase-like glycosyltransferase